MLEVKALLERIFDEENAPYTPREIASALRCEYKVGIEDSKVFYAISCLLRNPATAPLVQPLPSGGRNYLFSAPAARRIARHIVKAQRPEAWIKKHEAKAQEKNFNENRSQLRAKFEKTLKPLARTTVDSEYSAWRAVSSGEPREGIVAPGSPLLPL